MDNGTLNGMVDVSDKQVVRRVATAEGKIVLGTESLSAIERGEVIKGDVFPAARIAAIQGVKSTPQALAFCHPIPIESVKVEFDRMDSGISCSCTVIAHYKTGVEMEALMGVNHALLTIWDMVKYLEKDEGGLYPCTKIDDIRVTSKTKGE